MLWAGVGYEIVILRQGFEDSVVDDPPYAAILRAMTLMTLYLKVLLNKLRFSNHKEGSIVHP